MPRAKAGLSKLLCARGIRGRLGGIKISIGLSRVRPIISSGEKSRGHNFDGGEELAINRGARVEGDKLGWRGWSTAGYLRHFGAQF